MRRLVLVMLLAASASACATRRLPLPTGEGEPFPDYRQAFQEATSGCRDVRSLSAELAISGRAGREKLRGRVVAGLATPGRIRLEGIAPFGPPVFLLVADGSTATLLLPRDNRVLTGEPTAAILQALVGLALGPEDLLAVLAGCVVPDPQATGGRSFAAGWARIDLAGGATAYLQRDRQRRWCIRAGLRPPLRLEYELADGSTPTSVRLQAAQVAGTDSDLRIGLSQLELNGSLAAEVFALKLPADAAPITLAELKQAGPIGEKR
jgi:outer membrane lipoprotein-sorting protein